MQPSLQRLIAFVSVLALSCGVMHRASAQCPGDITGNGMVNGADLGLVLAAWGSDGSDEPGSDINADGAALAIKAEGIHPNQSERTRLPQFG
jgi:hypothetical protein